MEAINTFLNLFFTALVGNIFVRVLIIAVCADMVFGSLRAIKYRAWNSAVGIDGAIRKAGMLACVLLFTVMDMMVHADVLKWLPQEAQATLDSLGVVKMGITELFSVLFILYEATSVLKNMLLCGIPIPAGMREKLAGWLTSMTEETQVDVVHEVSHHAVEVDAHLDTKKLAALEGMTMEELHDLADTLGVEYQETDTTRELAVLIASDPAAGYLHI